MKCELLNLLKAMTYNSVDSKWQINETGLRELRKSIIESQNFQTSAESPNGTVLFMNKWILGFLFEVEWCDIYT